MITGFPKPVFSLTCALRLSLKRAHSGESRMLLATTSDFLRAPPRTLPPSLLHSVRLHF